jgi:hypothetical protein
MYLEPPPENPFSTTLVKVVYDCCGGERTLKWSDANKNYMKNKGKHICRPCWLKSDDNPARRPTVQEKIKKTNLEKYGVSCAMNTAENTANRVDQMFGTKERTEKVVEARRKTFQENYGVDHPMKDEGVKQKQQQTLMGNYGVTVPLKSEEIKAKMMASIKALYGCGNVMGNPDVVKKMQDTTEERFGVRHYNELPEMKEYLREHCKEWLAESYANPWAKGMPKSEETRKKASDTVSSKILAGTWNGGFKSNVRGRYITQRCRKENPRFLSGLELIMHFIFDHDDNVEWYDYEALVIPYKKTDGTNHNYHPDFLVKYKGDNRQHIFETKFWKNKDNLDVQTKQQAAQDYAAVHNMTYTLLFDEDVAVFGVKLEDVVGSPAVTLYK